MTDFDIRKYKYLFLDRDGVINVERPADYVKNTDEFIFIDGAIDAISILSRYFDEIFIITNQRGVGRNVMILEDLEKVHNHMLTAILAAGGKISKVYFCTDLSSSSVNRKPNIGMGFKVLEDFPDVLFRESIMIGNSRSDIDFGLKLGMYTILVGDKYSKDNNIYQIVDAYCPNLHSFALTLHDK